MLILKTPNEKIPKNLEEDRLKYFKSGLEVKKN